MAFSLNPSHRRSPKSRRPAASTRDVFFRDKVSPIGVFSVLLVIYAGVSLGLFLRNQNITGLPPGITTDEFPSVGAQVSSADTEVAIDAHWESRHNEPPSRRMGHDIEYPLGAEGSNTTSADKGGSPVSGVPFRDVNLRTTRNWSEAHVAEEPRGNSGQGLIKEEWSGTFAHDSPKVHQGSAMSPEERRKSRKVEQRKDRDLSRSSPPMEGTFDVTLVSQASKNRFWMLPFLCNRWPGPISIAILAEEGEMLEDETLCPNMMISATRAQNPEELDPVFYPVNRLRNVAVKAVQTTHFLMTDIDIWPDANAYHALHARYKMETQRTDIVTRLVDEQSRGMEDDVGKQHISSVDFMRSQKVTYARMEHARNAIVFTAFSRRRFCDAKDCLRYAHDVPRTITDLKPCLESDTCGRFDATNPSGQGTAYVYYWRSMLRKPNKRGLEHIMCFKSHRFEPYLVVRKSSVLPSFDERFTGYGKNKIQWNVGRKDPDDYIRLSVFIPSGDRGLTMGTMISKAADRINHLRYSGFSFFVMPVNFVIHAAHPKSQAKSKWEKTGGGKQGKGNKLMDIIFEDFMKELQQKNGEEGVITALCQPKPKTASKSSRKEQREPPGVDPRPPRPPRNGA